MRFLLVLALLAAGLAAGCSTPLAWRPSPGPSGYVVTLANLHPDQRGNLDSQNFQHPIVMPVCTPVVIEQLTDRGMVFTNAMNGQRHRYRIRRLNEPVEYHVARFFGPDCDRATMATLGPADQQGIRDGRVYQGMTKRGVIFALGWPPWEGTPSPDADIWRYWRNRSDTFDIGFVNGVVQYVRE